MNHILVSQEEGKTLMVFSPHKFPQLCLISISQSMIFLKALENIVWAQPDLGFGRTGQFVAVHLS